MTQLRWGILGVGDVVWKRVAQAIKAHPDSQLVAACRRSADELQRFCQEFAVPHAFTDDEQLLTSDEIDAVYIATPVADHCRQTLAAAAAGKHVLVEKPMAMTVDECDQMVDAFETANLTLGVAYYRRFYPVVKRIHVLLSEHAIGTPLNVTAITTNPTGLESGTGGWRIDPALGGGGPLMDIGSHRIDLFLDLFGPIAKVKAICNTQHGDFPVEDTALLIMQFESGMTGHLQVHFASRADPDQLVIQGSHGRIVVQPLNAGRLTLQNASGETTEVHPPASNFNGPMIADFVDAIQSKREPLVSGGVGRSTSVVMEQAYRSAAAT